MFLKAGYTVPPTHGTRTSPSSLLPSAGRKWTPASKNTLFSFAREGLGNATARLVVERELQLAQCNVPSCSCGAATSVTTLGGSPEPGKGSGWMYAGLSVTPRAPWLSHGVGGSMAPLLLPFTSGCVWAKLPLGELPGGWAVPCAAMAKQGG